MLVNARNVPPSLRRWLAVPLALGLAVGLSGCFLGVYETGILTPSGQFAFGWGVGGILSGETGLAGYVTQLQARYGLVSRFDVGVAAGFRAASNFREVEFAGVIGDLRYQLLGYLPNDPGLDLSLGWMPGNFPLFGDVLGGGAVYLSKRFEELTPYGFYRGIVRMGEDGELRLSHQVAAGVEVANPERVPALFELGWKDGLFLLGLAFRF